MKKSFFVVGAAALVLMLAACNQPVSLEPDRPGRPSNLVVEPSGDGNRAIVSWVAGRNAVNHQVVKRVGNHNPILVEPIEMRQGGQYSWNGNLHVWAYGDNTDQWSAVISLFTDWRGDFYIGARAVPFDFVLGTWTPSDIQWWDETVSFSDFIPVERIDLDESSLPPNAPLDLNEIASVYPDNATKQAISWEIWAGPVGFSTLNQRPGALEWLVLPDGILPYAGTFTVRGTVKGGINKGHDDFVDGERSITVGGTTRYDPITSLITTTGNLASPNLLPATVFVGEEFDLNELANLSPSDATNQTIAWFYALPWDEDWTPIPGGQLSVPDPGDENRFAVLFLRAIVTSGRLWMSDLDADVYIFGIASRISEEFVPVNTVDIPSGTTFTQRADHNLNLLATVSPSNATHQDISWAVQNQHVDQWGYPTEWSDWSAIPDGSRWSPTTFGDHRLRATIVRGLGDADYKMTNEDYVRYIPIVVSPVAAGSIVRVTDVTLPSRIVATAGDIINLNNHVTISPPNATNQEIIWDDIQAWGSDPVGGPEVRNPARVAHSKGVFELLPNMARLIVAGEIPDGEDRDNPFSFLTIIYIEPAAFIPVQELDFTLNPNMTIREGTIYDLNASTTVRITPNNATSRAIIWEYRKGSASDDISWNDIPAGLWTPPAAAWFEIRARIRNGHTVGRDFVSKPILFNAAGAGATHVPVTSINFGDRGQEAREGSTINLLAPSPVTPGDATATNIQWTIVLHTRDIGRGDDSRAIPMAAADNASTLTLTPPVRLYPWERMSRVEFTATIPNGRGLGLDFVAGGEIEIFAP